MINIDKRIITRKAKNTSYYINISLKEARAFADKYSFYKTRNGKKILKFQTDVKARIQFPKIIKGTAKQKQNFLDTFGDHKLCKLVVVDSRKEKKQSEKDMQKRFITYQMYQFKTQKNKRGLKNSEIEYSKILSKMFNVTLQEVQDLTKSDDRGETTEDQSFFISIAAKKMLLRYMKDNFIELLSDAAYELILTAKLYSKETISTQYIKVRDTLKEKVGKLPKIILPLYNIRYNLSKLFYITLLDLDLPIPFNKRRIDILIITLCKLSNDSVYIAGNKKVIPETELEES